MWNFKKRGIALLITVFFVMAITVAIGIGLKQVKEASWHVENEKFMLQTSMILNDVLTILQTSQELNQVATGRTSQGLFVFLSTAAFIPFESSGIKVGIQVKSARAKFNPNTLADANSTKQRDVLQEYLNQNRMNGGEYMKILLDNMGKIKEDGSYNSAIFNENPTLFRDYIASKKHLDTINSFYMQTYHDNNIKNIDFDTLFYFSKNQNYLIDLNYATPQLWEMMLRCDKTRAEQLSLGGGAYNSLEELDLSDEEKIALALFNTSYFEPYLDVLVDISQDSQSATIEFEYDISTKKGSHFVYEI